MSNSANKTNNASNNNQEESRHDPSTATPSSTSKHTAIAELFKGRHKNTTKESLGHFTLIFSGAQKPKPDDSAETTIRNLNRRKGH